MRSNGYIKLFKKLTKKSFLTILALIVIGIPLLYLTVLNSKNASASWFNEDWLYRKSIAITTHNTDENNVYISTTLDTSDTTRFQADCGDLRFTKQNGELLPYYIVSGCGGASTVIHINFDNFPAGAQTIYYYYGNPSAQNGFQPADFSTLASNYTVGSLGSEEKSVGPLVYWKFDEGTGSTAHDSSANAADATFPVAAAAGGTPTGTTNPTYTSSTGTPDVGTGADGACSVAADTNINTASCAGRGTADAINFSSTTNTAAAATAIQLTATSTGLAVGDEVLIINLRGTSADNSNVGKFETKTISSITTTTNPNDTLNFATGLTNGYNGTTQNIMVQRVPNYTTVTVDNTRTLTTTAWNGTKNGVLFFRANGAVTVTGSISMSSKGFIGAADQPTHADFGGNGGTSYNGTGGTGGTGNNGNQGQGGGGGSSACIISGKSGCMSGSGAAGTTGGAGGGGGGYYSAAGGGGGYGAVGQGGGSRLGSTNGAAGSGTTGGTGGNSIAGTAGGGGGGGGTYGVAALSTLYMGSGGGGGASGSQAGNGGGGGAGGGIISINALSLTVTGSIVANGAVGTNAINDNASGGGGAGGSVIIASQNATLGSSLVTATGGNGGTGGMASGGNGGAGRIAAVYTAGTPSDGGPSWITEDQCVSGKCISFNGTSNSATVSKVIAGVQTISFWIKPITIASTAIFDFDGGTHKITTNASGVISATGFTSPPII